MAPYGRDAGMTQRQADELAARIRSENPGTVAVEREGRFFVVVVEARAATYTIRDDADWAWLRRQLQQQE